jgi:flagellar hook-associated protein 3 FlgL
MSMQIRTTERLMGANALGNLQNQLTRLGRLQEQLSSGKQIQRPSDSPGGTAAAMQARGDISRFQQYSRNADDGKAWLGTIDSTLTSAMTQVHQARDLVLQGMSPGGSGSNQTGPALANQIDSIRQSLINVANTTYLGRPVFGGTTSGQLAYDSTGAYVGDSGSVMRTVSDTAKVRVDASGPNTFGSGPGGLFAVLGQISTDLRTGNQTALQADLGDLDTATNQMQSSLSDVGARYNQVQMMQDSAQTRLTDLTSQLSNVEDIDLPATITELQMQQVAYQAALSATSHVVQPSLVDFLK